MAEYIDREALLKRMETRLNQLRGDYGDFDHYTNGFDEGLVAVEDAPTADVVDVVRCKDCKHLMFSDFYGECKNNHLGIVKPWDYCSYGERKE